MTRRIPPRGCLLRDDLEVIVESNDAGDVESGRGGGVLLRDRLDMPRQVRGAVRDSHRDLARVQQGVSLEDVADLLLDSVRLDAGPHNDR